MAVKTNIQPNPMTDLDLTEEDLIALARLRGRKLGVLLQTSSMPDEIKQAWLALIPEMTLEQMDRFTDILEAEFLNDATAQIDDYFSQRLEKEIEQIEAEDAKFAKELDRQVDAAAKVYKELE